MALRNIVKEGDEVLRKTCRPVTEFNERLHILLDDMKETLVNADGAGLAAPQVGVLRRVALVSV
ncbi:MAG: peptide deformylase, partial [Oscillospiraceae bacterium]|nr:peptide deformylase [Oscillospiraceae bacterium]